MILDQLWTYDKDDMKLYNKEFGLQDKDWSIPNEETDGILEEKSSNKVLSLRQRKKCDFGLFPSLQKRDKIKTFENCEDASNAKIWKDVFNFSDGCTGQRTSRFKIRLSPDFQLVHLD